MTTGWTIEASRVANFLASMPSGTSTLNKADLHSLLMESGGMLMSGGYLYNIKATHLGAGVYKVRLELQE